jgi:hypothetical protein
VALELAEFSAADSPDEALTDPESGEASGGDDG